MDAYTRAIRGWGISCSLDEELVVRALEKALEHYIGVHFHEPNFEEMGQEYREVHRPVVYR